MRSRRLFDGAQIELGLIPVEAATGGGITGSANITLGALTVAGTGTLGPTPITGSANITLGALTLVGTGDVTSPSGITGSANITLDALTVAGAGTLGPSPITGAASITLGALTVSGAGTLGPAPITGSGNIILDALTLAGTGTISTGGITGVANITLGALTVAGTGTLGPEPPAIAVGGGPGNARGRQRPVYMVDDKIFDSPAAAARYLASVTLPEPASEAPRAAPRPRPKLAVQVAGEQMTVAPAIPVTATAEYAREMVQAELIQARRALQRRQRELEEEERAAVFAVVQMLLEDGETVTFH